MTRPPKAFAKVFLLLVYVSISVSAIPSQKLPITDAIRTITMQHCANTQVSDSCARLTVADEYERVHFRYGPELHPTKRLPD